MYAGEIVEHGAIDAIFRQPEHPYTVGLLGALPRGHRRQQRLVSIEGMVPDLHALPPGCTFEPRCPFARCALHGGGSDPFRADGAGPSLGLSPRAAGCGRVAAWSLQLSPSDASPLLAVSGLTKHSPAAAS